MRAGGILFASVGLVAAGCTALVSFNDVPGFGCDGGACVDATSGDVRPEDARSRDVKHLDVADAGGDALEAGDADGGPPDACAVNPDGGTCGVGDPCHAAPTCVAGVCTDHPLKDGTFCGDPIDVCHSIPVCKTGVCGPSTALPDGTQWKAGDDNARCCKGAAVETTSVDNCGVCDLKCNTKLGQKCTNVNDNHYFCTPCTTNNECWSGCCSLTIEGHCSPSDCATGACKSPNICPDGSHCQSDTVNYCSY